MTANQPADLQSYLEASGLLEHGTPEAIQAAKQVYKKQYQTAYRKQRRTSHPETTVTLTKEERDHLDEAAKRHNLSLPRFLRQAALGYLKRRYIVPDKGTVARIEQVMSLARTDIQMIAKHVRQLDYTTLAQAYQSLAERYTRLEEKLSQLLRKPEL